MTKKPLNDRLSQKELYFVFTGVDWETGDFWMLTFFDGRPRIYKKDAVDPRIGDIPVCHDFEAGIQKVNEGAMGVLLPISVLLDIFGADEMRRWSDSMSIELAAEVRAHTSEWEQNGPKRLRRSA